MSKLRKSGVPLTIMVVGEQQVVLAGLRSLLQAAPTAVVVGEATSGPAALRLLAELPRVQVAIVDQNMPEMAGAALITAIKQQQPNTQVLVLSATYDVAAVHAALAAGGSGFMLKSCSQQELLTAVNEVAARRTCFSNEVSAELLQHLEVAPPASDIAQLVPLTEREKQVLELIANEYSNNRIAGELLISERTVETHRKNILTKTRSKSVVGLIKYALRHKLIS